MNNNYMQVGEVHCFICHQDYNGAFGSHVCPGFGGSTAGTIACKKCQDLTKKVDSLHSLWKYCPHCGKDL